MSRLYIISFVVAVIWFLQDFNYDEKYSKTISALSRKIKEYWDSVKGHNVHSKFLSKIFDKPVCQGMLSVILIYNFIIAQKWRKKTSPS